MKGAIANFNISQDVAEFTEIDVQRGLRDERFIYPTPMYTLTLAKYRSVIFGEIVLPSAVAALTAAYLDVSQALSLQLFQSWLFALL